MIKRMIGVGFLKLFGWTTEGDVGENRKFVLIAAPHTSGWDLPFMLAIAYKFELPISWLGKHTLFEPPFGFFLRWLGGIPVDRRSPNKLVEKVAQAFREAKGSLVIAVPAEGTRGRRETWKSGFYWMASGAGVPIGLGFLDYGRKVGGIGPIFVPSGDVRADMDQIRAFYAGIQGKFPEHQTVPRLKEELAI
jgi:1-acyl-sn-glycerol-3-phosphate acyltransferase